MGPPRRSFFLFPRRSEAHTPINLDGDALFFFFLMPEDKPTSRDLSVLSFPPFSVSQIVAPWHARETLPPFSFPSTQYDDEFHPGPGDFSPPPPFFSFLKSVERRLKRRQLLFFFSFFFSYSLQAWTSLCHGNLVVLPFSSFPAVTRATQSSRFPAPFFLFPPSIVGTMWR